jgi:cytoskeletal protein RodZ
MNKQDLSVIGSTIKARRTELNLSIKEVENATSIRTAYLQAIEDGEAQKLISPVYAQGFVKQYASFLGLDGDRLVRENPEIFRSSPQEFSYGIGTLEVRGNPGAGVKWFPNAVWVIVSVAALLTIWLLAHFLGIL